MMPFSEIETQKQCLRAEARAKRRAIPADAQEEAAKAVAHMDLSFLGSEHGTLAAYYPVRSEFDCLPLARRLSGEGWQLALPVIVGSAPLEFHQWGPGAPVVTGPFGIPQPTSGDIVAPTVLLVPLLAYDRRCYRLGYGGGNYDRTLTALRANGVTIAVGLAFDSQEVDEVPVCPYDEQLDWILTPSGPVAAIEGH
jgi:5-formyltetrahydrofolate cyclo-ligase